jgi:hypothetical protein
MSRGCVVVALVVGVAASALGQAGERTTLLFRVGKEDDSNREFAVRGFADSIEYTCTVGQDWPDAVFPGAMYRLPIAPFIDDGVGRVVIRFALGQAQDEIVLRLVRAGAETTVVTVDDLRQQLVTSAMLGSGENSVYGSYNLILGRMERGLHTIKLTIADDGKGNGRFAWDALSLLSR